MKVQLGEIRAMLEGLKVALDLDFEDITVGYWLAKAQRQLIPEFVTFDQARLKLAKKYAKRDDNGELMVDEEKGQYVMDNQDAFDLEIGTLAEQEAEIGYNSIPVSDITGVAMKGSVIAQLGRLIGDPEEKGSPEVLELPKE